MPDLATTMIDAHHSAYVDNGAITADPANLPDYDASQPDPGTTIMVVDREGWATLHVIEARGFGKIEFGPRIAWPDGRLAARQTAETVALASAAVAASRKDASA